MYREDFSLSQQLLLTNDPEDVTVDIYPDQDPDLVVEKKVRQPNLEDSSGVLLADVSQAPDGFLSQEKEAEAKSAAKSPSSPTIFLGKILTCPHVCMYVCMYDK